MQARFKREIICVAVRWALVAVLSAVGVSGCKNTVEEDCNILLNQYCAKLASCDPTTTEAQCLANQTEFTDCNRLQATYDSCSHTWDYCQEDLVNVTCAQLLAGELPESCRRIATSPCDSGIPPPQ